MAVTPFDSGLYRDLFHDAEIGSLFSDSAEVRAMMLVEGALAKVQGQLGIIPELSAAFITRSCREIQVDPTGLAAETGANGIPVPALVKAMRTAMEAPEHAQYLHWGATTQDIMDTALALRLRQVFALIEKRLEAVLWRLADMAETHAELPMAGRTWMQVATPTSFGAVLAGWGLPLWDLHYTRDSVSFGFKNVSLSGAAGTGAAYGPKAAVLRQKLADELRLGNRDASWHSARNGIAGLSAWLTQISASLAKIGEDILLMTQSGIGELRLGGGGSSSTMPQKQNPVAPSLLSALARGAIGANTTVQGAAIHRQQRDAAAWMSEWIALGQVCMSVGRGLNVAEDLLGRIEPDAAAMLANIDDGRGLIYAEALQFALTDRMSRPEAQAAVKELCQGIIAAGGSLRDAAIAKWGDADLADLFTPEAQLGLAPTDAKSFAAMVRA
ncbi:lyase family protein [uncultured Litoreibacter sp.]|uniref:lyase family protein n=1 Tax=uncultured Litoreibacter sp. TaxID=1392394 RepID=UPI0026394600|nr:lyase family protein [uncultured Litoreibacter sp.]